MESRYCSNCRAELPARAGACPACGVFAGDVYDGRAPAHVRAKRWRTLFSVIVLLALVVGAGAFLWSRPDLVERLGPARSDIPVLDTSPVRVVRDRPGGAMQGSGASITEPEAILILRRSMAATTPPVKGECLAITSQGFERGVYNLTAFNHCEGTRLGRWQVDAQTREVRRR